MKMMYVVIKEYGFNAENFKVIGVFNNLETAQELTKNNNDMWIYFCPLNRAFTARNEAPECQ